MGNHNVPLPFFEMDNTEEVAAVAAAAAPKKRGRKAAVVPPPLAGPPTAEEDKGEEVPPAAPKKRGRKAAAMSTPPIAEDTAVPPPKRARRAEPAFKRNVVGRGNVSNDSTRTHMLGPREQVCLTPEWLLGLLAVRFGPFDFDPAPDPKPEGFDGLAPDTRWGKRNFLNPPFFNLDKWVAKAITELREHGNQTLILGPFRPHLKWWLTDISGKFAVLPIIGYVRFRGYKDELPHPLVCIWFSHEPVPPEMLRLQHAIFRPLEVARIRTNRRCTHDTACQGFPGAIVDMDGQFMCEGPVAPFMQLEGVQNSERKASRRRNVEPPVIDLHLEV